jgi:hypothetical protein
MPVTDYSTRLRELAERCRRAARNSFEVETKGTFPTVAVDLSGMADELEQRPGLHEPDTRAGDAPTSVAGSKNRVA